MRDIEIKCPEHKRFFISFIESGDEMENVVSAKLRECVTTIAL